MLWPEHPDNWRLGAGPAQRAFARVAVVIARFEPVTVGTSAAQYLNARYSLPACVRLVEIASDDAWKRDCRPVFFKNDQGLVRGVDWDFNAWGGSQGGLYSSWEQFELVAQKVLEIEARNVSRRILCWRGVRSTWMGRGFCSPFGNACLIPTATRA